MPSDVEKKLNEIIVPVVDFEEATLEEVVEFLRASSIEFDRSDVPPEQRGSLGAAARGALPALRREP